MTLLKNNTDPQSFSVPDYSNTAYSAIGYFLSKLNLSVPLEFKEKLSIDAKIYVDDKVPDKLTRVFIIIADSVGYQNLVETNTFQDLRQQGQVLILDSVFPTVTPVIMASLTHSRPPSYHELVGYCIYNPKIKTLMNTIVLRAEINGKLLHVEKLGLNKHDVIKGTSISRKIKQKLKESNQNGKFIVYIPTELNSDGIGIYLYQDNETITYDFNNPSEILQKALAIERNSDKNDIIIHSIYLPHPDHVSHHFGNQSKEYAHSVKMVEEITLGLKKLFPQATILLTSDHGQINLPKPKSPNRPQLSLKEIKALKEKNVLLGFSGRTFHFYYDKESSESNDAVDSFLDKYGLNNENGTVLDINEETKEIIGPSPSRMALAKLGTKVVVFSPGFYIDHVALGEDPSGDYLVAQHGGLSWRELKVPFIIL